MSLTNAYLLFFFWLLGFVFLWKIPYPRRREAIDSGMPEISIIIPARNEEKTLVRLLHSLKGQSLEPREIIVVDDFSTDSTAELAVNSGCIVLSSLPLPEGRTGKPWACWQGAQKATGDLLVFLDADSRLEADGLAKMVHTYMEEGGLLTIQPYHHMDRPYERLSAFFNIIILAGMNAFTPVQSRVKPMGAFGPCNICSRKDYFAAGGHQEARGKILESLDLAKHFLRADRGIHCYGGKGTVSFRMYPEGIRSLIEGFSKGFGTGAQATSWLVLLMIIAWITGGVDLTRHIIQSAILGDHAILLPLLGIDALYVLQIHWMLNRIGNFGFSTALLFQIPLLFFVAIFVLSLLRIFLLKKVRWKGRVIDPSAKDTMPR